MGINSKGSIHNKGVLDKYIKIKRYGVNTGMGKTT